MCLFAELRKDTKLKRPQMPWSVYSLFDNRHIGELTEASANYFIAHLWTFFLKDAQT
jgi:hypothetical protein